MATSFRRELPYVFSFTLIVSVTLGLWDLKLFVCLPVNMYIKSIEISGFKSYGQRVEIKGFDPLFNAITGLNGSGKSNILDAICFVLGITNLQQVRANNLQELVYKNGQAGITKAAVSITFDNSDPSSSPLGYEQHKEIIVTRIVVIGGKNKFLINGTVANNHRVQDFFQSVSLNVNNPHFLIMQGRITKVLNMKPKEILSMVEEAAGTRMYEMKKESSLKLMMKKEERLKEIDSVVEEQITPTLTKLREERKDYVEYTKVLRELEHLTKLHVAWQFLRAKEMCTTSSEDAKRIEEEIKATQDKICEIKQKLSQMDEDMKALEKKRDEEAGGKLSDLEKILKEKQLNEAKVTNSLQNLKSVLKDSMKKKTELQKNQKEETAALTNREKDIANQEKKIKDLEVACEEDAAAVKAAEKHLQDVNAGLVQDAEGKAATIASQIMAAEQDIKRAETEEKMASMTLTKLKEELSKKQAAYTEMDESYSSNQNSYKAVEKQINKMRQEIEKIGYDEERARKVKATREQLEKEMRRLHDNLDEMRSRNTHMEFEYVDPVRNFDRRKVHGLVCNLIRLKDPATALALELAAGGRLFNVVVDNDQTGKLLLEQGQLRRRVTIIPLNKISSRPIERDVIQRAEKLVGKENVSTALSLISYNKEDEPAMEYVFGNVFICSNMEAAKRVAFTEGINKRCVTLEGEVFDPAGTLSGGSMTQKTRNLIELSKMRTMEEELQAKQQKLHEVVKEMQKLNSLGERYESLQSSYELKVSEMEALRRKVEQSNYHQQQQEIENLKKSIEEKQKIIVECKQLKKKSEARYKELKQTDTKSARQQELKNAEKALTDKQKKAAVSEKQYKEAEQQLEQFKLEAEDLRQSLANCKQQMTDVMATINEQEQKVTETDAKLKEMKDDVAKVSEEVKGHKNLLKSHSIELGKLQKAKDLLSKDCGNAQLHVQQLEHDIVKSKEDAKDAEKSVEKMLSTYPWIEEQRKYFGVPNTEYDFTNYDAKSTAHRLNSLQEAKGKLSKSVNIRAQNMLANAEEQYKDLQLKKKVVLNDREQIRMVIRELDEQKRRSLKTACEQVNKDFGSIFSTLLPGAKAKLMSQEDEKGAIEGLEFKVGFGDVWKESLTELSGGQRSLVALSLILSLLLFKPAPIYILDEVDAALDLSHTQNIGQMLKKHFQKSQFIVVSLKDGMFSNANVLFKTRFVDGMSTVTRISRKN